MKHILDYGKYDGGQIKEGTLYTGEKPFTTYGRTTFRVFGSARLNGHLIKDTEITTVSDNTISLVGKDSAIVFYRAPVPKPVQDEFIPVPDVPELLDDTTASIYQMIEDYLRKTKILPGEAAKLDFDDLDMDDDDEDYDGPPLDDYSLIEEQSDIDIGHEEGAEILENADSDIKQKNEIKNESTGILEQVPAESGENAAKIAS